MFYDYMFLQTPLLLSVLTLASGGERGQGCRGNGGRGCGEGEEEGEKAGVGEGEEAGKRGEKAPAVLTTTLSLLLDHFTYLQGTQGNQKKVFVFHFVLFSVLQKIVHFCIPRLPGVLYSVQSATACSARSTSLSVCSRQFWLSRG